MTGQLQTVRDSARVFASLLDATLAQVGIRPIPDDIVEEYMQEQLDRAPASNFIGRLLDRFGVHPVSFYRATMLGLTILQVVGAASFMAVVPSVYFAAVGQLFPALLCLAVAVGGAVTFSGALYTFWGIYLNELPIEIVGPARWVTMTSENMRWMPEFAVSEMLRIQRHNPDVRFEVADLRQNDYSLDPVLFAILGDERRAVLVWDRNKYYYYEDNRAC